LQNKTSNRSLRYYLFLLRLARFFGRPILFCGAGIGPLIGKRACVSVAQALQQCRYIGVRDFESLRFLRALGVDAALLHEGADPALLLPPPPFSRASYLLQKAALTSKKRLLCLVMRGGKGNEATFSILIASTRILCARYDLEPLLLLLDTSHDADATSYAKAALNATVLAYRNTEDIMAILSCADCLISMRLHAMVFGCSVGTPGIGIVADPRDGKIEAFCKSAGLESIPADRLTVPLLVEHAELLMREKKRHSALLCASRDELRKKAEKDLENITKMIYNSRQ
jgi:polysaccharide pyruvyl transferase WcaK-like protein